LLKKQLKEKDDSSSTLLAKIEAQVAERVKAETKAIEAQVEKLKFKLKNVEAKPKTQQPVEESPHFQIKLKANTEKLADEHRDIVNSMNTKLQDKDQEVHAN
jgi:small-conductance mechanosensitive channel